jgi:hypothetical protein
MPRLGFEPTIPVFEREKTFHALDYSYSLNRYLTDTKAQNRPFEVHKFFVLRNTRIHHRDFFYLK